MMKTVLQSSPESLNHLNEENKFKMSSSSQIPSVSSVSFDKSKMKDDERLKKKEELKFGMNPNLESKDQKTPDAGKEEPLQLPSPSLLNLLYMHPLDMNAVSVITAQSKFFASPLKHIFFESLRSCHDTFKIFMLPRNETQPILFAISEFVRISFICSLLFMSS
eukprot:GDKJ01022373.1.p1 GENE.GDKJ01022373.1~~GDKJ01022373.1.p1  ORF type:complete len:164 (+),score=47.04 GDKJ01022373.1:747-1238(+)